MKKRNRIVLDQGKDLWIISFATSLLKYRYRDDERLAEFLSRGYNVTQEDVTHALMEEDTQKRRRTMG